MFHLLSGFYAELSRRGFCFNVAVSIGSFRNRACRLLQDCVSDVDNCRSPVLHAARRFDDMDPIVGASFK